MKIEIKKDGETQWVKQRFLHSFLNKGWEVVGEKKVSKIGTANATADVIEEEYTPQEQEDDTSMPNHNEGEE